MKNKMTFSEWLRKHKKAIIITGTGAAVVVGGILAWKKWTEISEFVEILRPSRKENVSLTEVIDTIPSLMEDTKTQEVIMFPVRGFVRNLPEGYHPSPFKIATAAENGFELGENQTWVRPTVKTKVA